MMTPKQALPIRAMMVCVSFTFFALASARNMIEALGNLRILASSGIAIVAFNVSGIGAILTPIPPPSGIQSWWPGEGNFNDIRGPNSGTNAGGVTFGPGKVRQAFHFDGSANSYIALPNSATFAPASNQVTIAAWIRPDFTSSNRQDTIFSKRDGCGFNRSYLLSVSKAGLVPLGYPLGSIYWSTSVAGDDAFTAGIFPSDGQFHFVAGTYDGTTMNVYLDGVLVGQKAHTGPIPVTSEPPYIGLQGGCGDLTVADFDEMQFYDRALSESEILAIYNAASAGVSWTVTSLADDGSEGTLRYSIVNATSGDTIDFNVTGTITLTQGVLEIDKNLMIAGPGAGSLTISGDHTDRVFQIDPGTTVTICGVTLQDGLGNVSGGEILNHGNATVTDSVFILSTPSNGQGGGIFNDGTLTVANSNFFGNPAFGVAGDGGAIHNRGTATVANSTFANLGVVGYGGGVYNAVGASLAVTNSTFWHNLANAGGAIFNNGHATVVSSTLSGNNAADAAGAGIYNLNATTRVKNTLLANAPSSAGNCYVNGGDVDGALVSEGYNLSDDNSCPFIQAGDLNNTPALLDPAGLKNNGGPVQTIALLSSSPAIDAIPADSCSDVAGNPISTDQRSVARPQGTACDIGAFEREPGASTTSSLVSSANPSTVSQSVTLTATVAPSSGTGTPTGIVTFKDGTTTLGTGTLNASGLATYATSSLSVGAHSITASYAGDSHFDASTAALTQTVNQATTSAGLVTSANPSTYGQSVAFTATVSSTGGVPTGVVTFEDGTTVLGTGTLNGSGQATLATAVLSVGSHSITAAYGGDTNFTASTSGAVGQTVAKAGTTTTLASSPSPSTVGQTVNFVATVVRQYGGTATGNVTFKEGTKVLGTASLLGGAATLPLSSLGVGSHSVTAVYSGDANSNGSTSSAVSQSVVAKTVTTTTLSSSLNPSSVGQLVTFTATLAPSGAGTPSGTVTFKQGQTVLGIGAMSAGRATFSTSSLSAGSLNIVAMYGGDAQFAGSTSPALTQTVNKYSTATGITSSPNPSSLGQPVTLTATVTSVDFNGTLGPIPTGTVSFKEGNTTIGTGTLDGPGVATFNTSTLGKGKHNVKAVYAATNSFAGSTSAVITQLVQ